MILIAYVDAAALTAKRCNWGIYRLDKGAFTMKLYQDVVSLGLKHFMTFDMIIQHTSSQVFASKRIQPSSITSAESLVTYTPCSSQVVATWITT